MKLKVRKPIFAFLILFLMLAILSMIIIFLTQIQNKTSIINQREKTAISTSASLKLLGDEIGKINSSAEKKTKKGVDLMVYALQSFIKDGKYEGPELYGDGIVVHVKDGKIIYPEKYPYHFYPLTAADIEKQPGFVNLFMTDDAGDDNYTAAISVKKIIGDTYLIDYTEEAELEEIFNDEVSVLDLISDIQKGNKRCLVLIDTLSPDLDLFYTPNDFPYAETALDLGITRQTIEEQTGTLMIKDTNYSAIYKDLNLHGRKMTAIILDPSEALFSHLVHITRLFVVLTSVAAVIFILWLYWTQAYVRDHTLTEAQKEAYHPAHIRRVSWSFGLTGTLVILILTIFYQSLDSIAIETETDSESLELMIRQINQNEDHNSRQRKNDESWLEYYAELTAGLLSDYPQFITKEFLQKAADSFSCEYVLLFDGEGREINSSNDYVGLDLEDGMIAEGSDFKRLMQGAETIIHEPQEDRIAGKNTQITGARVKLPESSKFGVLLLATDPEKSWMSADRKAYSSFLKMITPSGKFSAVVNKGTQKILFSSNSDFEGEAASDAGLYGQDAIPTDLDSFLIPREQTRIQYYGPYYRDDNYQYYFLTEYSIIQENTLPFAIGSAVSFALIFLVLGTFMLHPYRAKIYNEIVRTGKTFEQNSVLDDSYQNEWARLQNPNPDEDRDNILKRWRLLVPEEKTAIFSRCLLILVVINAGLNMRGVGVTGARSSIGFILQGNWTRGINYLSLAGSVLLILIFTIFVLFKNLLQTLLKNLLDRKAETVSRLIFSLIQYAAVITLLFLIFEYLGFDTRTLLASVGILSFAVTLGAKDLVADILAGIFIIFEDDFHVGDIIEVNGFSGIVMEIGVRSTKLLGLGDNIKIIGNQSVKDILNMTKMNSWHSVNLRIPADQPLPEIEAMLEKELPAIGASIPEILSGPYYKGLMEIGSVNTLYITVECTQFNYRRVQRELNHALRTLFDENGYKIG